VNKTKNQKQLNVYNPCGILVQLLAERLYSIGIETPEQMKRSNPEEIYEKIRKKEGGKLDKCVLYQLHGAVLDVPWWDCKNLTKDPLNQNKS